MIAVSFAMNSTKNLNVAGDVSPQTTTLITTPTRFDRLVHQIGVELRTFAEQFPGKSICHFVALHNLVFLTCYPDADGITWALRLVHFHAPRPQPYSLAAERWDKEIETWRNCFAVPAGATMRYDPDLDGLDDGGYAVIITWREITPVSQAPLI